MTKEEFIPFKTIMKETKKNNPESYLQIIDEANKEVEKIKKRGGKRPGAGRKRFYSKERKRITRDISTEASNFLSLYARKNGISQNKALDIIITKFKNTERA